MHLKSIEMQGFKSFADKIYLDFNPGITAIVGPNGSGKSNISDAIRWVMGEQSAKSLRGTKMEDVIFSGTEARKPLGFAEVTLVLDNSDHYFSLDFPEITVTRRVYRSGEGEYYINKTLCRLKDIHELFMDTGLGRDGYSVIGQGKIDSVLSSKSEDRRQIFEEAAGISKYKYRKIEAERKLTQATDNLSRVEDILGELEGRLEPLKQQSEKAKKYLFLRDEMRELDITVSVITAENAKGELSVLQENMTLLDSQIQEIKAGIEDTENEIARMYEAIESYDTETEQSRIFDQGAVAAIHEKNNLLTIFQSDVEHNEQNIARLREEIKQSESAIEQLDASVKERKSALEALKAKHAGMDQSLTELTEESKQTDRVASKKNDAMEAIKGQIIDAIAQINALRASCDSLSVLAENFLERKAALDEELSIRKESAQSVEKLYNEGLEKLAACEQKSVSVKKEQENKAQGLFEKETQLDALSKEKEEFFETLRQKESRRKMLQDMERDFEGYGRGVKSVMQAYQNGEIKNAIIFGPLSQLIKTERKYITAIETALGAANQNIVTATEEDAKAAIGYLKSKNLGRATFLPISAIEKKEIKAEEPQGEAGYIAVAKDLVTCDNRYNKIVDSFLGTTIVCDTLDHAIAMAKKHKHRFRIVTLDGDVVQAGGAMTGGSRSKSGGSLSRTGEIETLGKDISALEKRMDEKQTAMDGVLLEMEAEKQAISALTDALQALQEEKIRLEAEAEHLESKLSEGQDFLMQAENEHQSILARLSDIENEKADKNLEIQKKTEECTALELQVSMVQKEFSELSGRNEQLISRLTELNIERNAVAKDIELENDRISRLNDEKAHYLHEITTKNGGIQTLYERNADIGKEMEACKTEIADLEEKLAKCRGRIEELGATRTDTEKQAREKQASIKDVQEQMFALSQQHSKMENRAAKFELEIETVVNRLLEEYDLPFSEAAAIKREEDFDFKDASAKIKNLREQIRQLGNINIDAIEEYKTIQERFDFLSAQAADLEKAKKELESVIEDMQSIMHTKFTEQFHVINKNFDRVFQALFGGGRATLSLSEPENVLESGIEIEAQPPGKKLQSLSLLSGGERAFTAIALLFAILEVRPTPFCILDEIEAALDDVNVYRTAEYLKNYSNKTQFIVVTHRRGTMEAANILYGVTMQERGISKLLSLHIDDIPENQN